MLARGSLRFSITVGPYVLMKIALGGVEVAPGRIRSAAVDDRVLPHGGFAWPARIEGGLLEPDIVLAAHLPVGIRVDEFLQTLRRRREVVVQHVANEFVL